MTYTEFRFLFNAVDYDRSVRFYSDLLGMEVLESWDRPSGKGTILSGGAGGRAFIEIFSRQGGPAQNGPDPSLDLSIALSLSSRQEIDTFYSKFLSISKTTSDYRYQIAELPADRPWGHYSFTLLDPNGIRVTLYFINPR